MASSIFTDCSSIQGSITSSLHCSSSDMLTLTTAASSWCAIPTSARIRMIRLVRPHTRRILVAPGSVPSYGFAVRGGKEFGTGFFVASVDRNSEAEQKGLRIGDQILRINGFRVDDAIHKEFVQLVANQERLTLKVRSVGMLPIKDKENERLSWNVVKTHSISATPSECSSYQSTIDRSSSSKSSRDHAEREINIILNVAPRTKLGLGICKGPEWKPGIFVQFTKEKSVAREAGLRPGDQILSVNSIDFSDVLFSEAVAVMKSSNCLDMMVRTGAGCDLFPGESSGYNSSASSVTGDQSPCWADVKSKRLTSVKEEPTIPASRTQLSASLNQNLNAVEQRRRTKSNAERNMLGTGYSSSIGTRNKETTKEINKTIIKLSENGTSINNTYVSEAATSGEENTSTIRRAPAAREHFGSSATTATKATQSTGTLTNMNKSGVSNGLTPPPPPPPFDFVATAKDQYDTMVSSQSLEINEQNMNDQIIIGGIAATMQRYKNINQYGDIIENKKPGVLRSPSSINEILSGFKTSEEIEAGDGGEVGGSSLSSAITEELKKRKAKLQSIQKTNCDSNNYSSHNLTQRNISKFNGLNAENRHFTNSSSTANSSNNNNPASSVAVDDKHSALMSEFKLAHKRMFKNGFKECDEDHMLAKERQEALKRTSFVDEIGIHRAKGTKILNKEQTADYSSTTNNNNNIPPPPPPEFANSNESRSHHNYQQQQQQQQRNHKTATNRFSTHNINYDNVEINENPRREPPAPPPPTTASSSSTTTASVNGNKNRQTLRLGTVTIGEYQNDVVARKEPGKFDFISTNSNATNGETSLQNELQSTLSRANLRKSNGNTASYMEHKSNCPLQQQRPQSSYNMNTKAINNHSKLNMGEITKQLQKTSVHEINFSSNSNSSSTQDLNVRRSSSSNYGTGTSGILKNGSRKNSNAQSTTTKSTEKSIKFG